MALVNCAKIGNKGKSSKFKTGKNTLHIVKTPCTWHLQTLKHALRGILIYWLNILQSVKYQIFHLKYLLFSLLNNIFATSYL